jgi:hypothetical protein
MFCDLVDSTGIAAKLDTENGAKEKPASYAGILDEAG